MIVATRRATRAMYGTWWRAMPWALPMLRSMCPMLIALTPFMIRVGAWAAFTTAMLTIVFSLWGLKATMARSKAKNGWFPWEP